MQTTLKKTISMLLSVLMALSVFGGLTFTAAAKETLIVTADAKTKVFGEPDPQLTYQISGLAEGDTAAVTLVREPGEDVGSYRITADVDADEKYVVSFTGAELTIEPRLVAVIADPKAKTYGEADPALTYTCYGLMGDDVAAGELTREPGEAYGSYAILQGTVTVGDNYTIDYYGAELTIAQKIVSVTAQAKSKTYGDDDPALTYTVEGLEDGDEMTGALARDEGENVGTHAITLGTISAGDNYAVNYTGAALIISPKAIIVTADAQTKVYGDDDPALTYTVNGLVNGDGMTGNLTCEAGQNVGTYAITQGTLSAGNNYDITFTGATLTVTKRPLTVVINHRSKVQDKKDPELTYTVNGLVEGDEISVTLTREPGEAVGNYAITAEIEAGDNYEVTCVGADFSIRSKYCPLCGEVHDGNIFDRIVGVFHRFIYFLKNLFKGFSK